MSDFIASGDRDLLERHGLASFDALWALELEPVDEPNTERGGWSSVYRLELEGRAYYLKKQRNHLTRSVRQPLGEPTFSREFRNIRRYRELGIPALQAAFFAQCRVAGEQRAVLLTQALDGWQDLDVYLKTWEQLDPERQLHILRACGALARTLHQAGQMHGCFYPKHIFLKPDGAAFQACLIDLEKTRPLWLGRRDRIKDLEPLLRRARQWNAEQVREFLRAYLCDEADVQRWWQWLESRRQRKESR